MPTRTVVATVTDPAHRPREGLAVHFAALEGHAPVIAMTDASGVFRAELEPDVEYRVPVENAVIVDGLPFPAGTVFVVRVPDGEGDVAGIDAMVGTIDASRPALLDAIAALTARIETLEQSLHVGGAAAGTALGDAAEGVA
jgi:hypothetical protein